jgi:uncharacterized protein YidB (DUF937 family)
MSTTAKVLLGLLALYAAKNLRRAPSAQQTQPSSTSTSSTGLGDLLKGPLGGLLVGTGLGAVLNNGLGSLLNQLKDNGHAAAADSWVSSGPNKDISQSDLAKALGADTLDQLARETGLQREEVLNGLSRNLPRFVDQLTPNARLPTEAEWQRML